MKTFVLASMVLLLAACSSKNQTTEQAPVSDTSRQALIARGRYLTTIGACNDCHSPKIMTPNGPEPDTSRLLSGHPEYDSVPAVPNTSNWLMFTTGLTSAVGPWGESFAANLTPHETGIKHWTFKQFQTALRKGKYKGLEAGRPLLPPMPWQMYKDMSDDDMKAIFTYLKSLKPVENHVHAPIPPDKLKREGHKI